MRWGERQLKVEEKFYEAVEDIAEELKINTEKKNKLPHLCGRQLPCNCLFFSG